MAITKTWIANDALSIIQDSPVTSIDEDSDRARSCKTFFQSAYEIALSAHPWKWALERRLLSRDANVPAFGYKYQYRKPMGCIRIFSVYKDGIPIQDKTEEGDFILCDEEGPIQIKYTSAKSNIATMPSWLAEIVSAKLAEKVSSPLKKEESDFQRALALYGALLSAGKRINAAAGSTPPAQLSGFEKAMKGLL